MPTKKTTPAPAPAPAPKATKPATKAPKATKPAPAPAVEAARLEADKAEALKAEALARIEARTPAPRGQGKNGSKHASIGTSNHGDTGRELAPAADFTNPRASLVPTFFDTVIANPDLLEFTGIKAQWAARLAALAGRTAHSYAQTINRLQGGGALTANHPIRINRAMFDAYRAHLGLDA